MKSECHICLSILITVALVDFLFLTFAFPVQLNCHFCVPGDKDKWNFNVLKTRSKLQVVIYLSKNFQQDTGQLVDQCNFFAQWS